MQNCAIVLGGFETGYMRKLALYLDSRLEKQVQVGIVQEPEQGQLAGEETVWIGPEKFIEKLKERAASHRFIVLTEEEPGEEDQICRYQPCEKLYQDIMLACQRMRCFAAAGVCNTKQRWIVMTADEPAAVLMAFSVICAQLLGQSAGVLYLNLSECSGMERLFGQEPGTDLSDLILALREGRDVCLDAYVRQLEGMDYIMPPGNPMILHELREEDVQRLLETVWGSSRYEYVVLAMGSTCCGCGKIFETAQSLFHLTGKGIVQDCSRMEWDRFVKLCLGDRQIRAEQISVPEIRGESCGVHLLYEWLDGPLGRSARKYMGKEPEQL